MKKFYRIFTYLVAANFLLARLPSIAASDTINAEPCWLWSYTNAQGLPIVRLGGKSSSNLAKAAVWRLAERPNVNSPLVIVEIQSALRLNDSVVAEVSVAGSDAPRMTLRGRWHNIPDVQRSRSVIWLASEVAGVFMVIEQCEP